VCLADRMILKMSPRLVTVGPWFVEISTDTAGVKFNADVRVVLYLEPDQLSSGARRFESIIRNTDYELDPRASTS
jgi:hypothetical protein